MHFIGSTKDFQHADTVILGIPFDGTSSFRPGSRFAPFAIREASFGLETYSPYCNKDLTHKHTTDRQDLELPFGNTQKVLQLIQQEARHILHHNKTILSLGGEHLVSLPLVEAYCEKYPDLVVFQFDAHADLRDEYLGEHYSHATVLRRLYDRLEAHRIYQFGIRSGTQEEFLFGQKNTHFYPYSLHDVRTCLSQLSSNTPLYLTIDLDVLDPSIFPGTGTPEPGGITFIDLLNALHQFAQYRVVGADVVELAPHYDSSGVSSLVAAKIVRELLLVL